ncbi:MAG: discoidin domain-containing protein [Planctomycetes bacterium]|nr:discoidin domain-containing protein [Planctomycetota bacterium]
MRSTVFVLVVLAGILAGAAQAQTTYVLLQEDFEGLTLGPSVDEGVKGTNVWTDIPSPGWVNDASGVPGIEDPANDGVTEWAGWGFAKKDWWVETAGDQRRSEFKLGQGTVAIADPDEWDDAAHPGPITANPYDVWLSTPPIDLSSAVPGTVQLKFDSSWRPEYDDNYHQTASITVSFDGGAKIEVLRWESNSASPNYKDDNSTNQTIIVDIPNPPGAGSMVLTFGLFDAGNDWWWAIDNIVVTGKWSGVRASNPSPANGAKELPVRTTLSWTPGDYAGQHRVLLSDDEAAVANDAAVVATQDANSFDATGLLAYGKTYYWRVDESNSTTGWDEGSVWRFSTEAFSYPIKGVVATASSAQTGMTAQNTVNGSGLNANDEHSTDGTQMWMTSDVKPHWIQFAFDGVYKLDKMWVWNSNQLIESMIGFGAKDVTVEYSVDGTTWTKLEGTPEFARGTGMPTYTANTTVSFNGAVAQFVKLTINANWGGMAAQTGLSEVRFFYIPVQASEPDPANGVANAPVEPVLSWRAGREAVSHKVYFGSNEQAVAAGTAPVATAAENSYVPAGLTFGSTYFWKVTEVNQAEATAEWEGPVWSFTVEQYGAIDNFEVYTDNMDAEETIWQAWIDGMTTGASGSQVGYTNAPFAERSIVHGGKQSMPMTYDNSKAPFYSEGERTFTPAQDLTKHGADSLCLYYQGVATNSAEGLYLTVKDSAGKSKTVSIPTATTQASWQQWKIPLTEFTSAGVKMTAVKSIVIGVGNRTSPATGGTGTMYFDDLGYGRSAP